MKGHGPHNLPPKGESRRYAFITLAAVASVGVILAFYFISSVYRDAVFPPKSLRYDITDVWVAPGKLLCPELNQSSSKTQIEQCIQGLSLKTGQRPAALKPLHLPDLNSLPINGYPTTESLLTQQNLTEAVNTLKHKEIMLWGFKLPRRLFLEDRLAASPNVLTMAQIDYSRICYFGQCLHAANPQSYLDLYFPLFAPSSADSSEEVDTWIVMYPSRFGINLEYGMFVTPLTAMRKVSRVHTPLIVGSGLLNTALLLGIMIIGLIFAMLWLDYTDFAAFGVMVSLYFIQSISKLISGNMPKEQLPAIVEDHINMSLHIFAVAATIFFAISTLRPNAKKFWRSWGLTNLGLVAVSIIAIFYNLFEKIVVSMGLSLYIINLVIPAAIAGYGYVVLRKKYKETSSLPSNEGTYIKIRSYDQLVIMALLILLATPMLIKWIQNSKGNWTYDLHLLQAAAIFPLFAYLVFSSHRNSKNRAENYQQELVLVAKQAAVGEMVQMLAHDVRKPFSLLRIAIDMLSRSQSMSDVQSILKKLNGQVKKSLKSVNDMLEDILSVSSVATSQTEQISVKQLIEKSLQEAFMSHPQASMDLTYELHHTHLLLVDSKKMMRVFNNIIENAIQATKGSGRIWCKTRNINHPSAFMEITIGNSDSYIPPAERNKIFNPFFTKGKNNGTGLGLSIAQKFIALHDGSIECQSSVSGGTEFILTLPCALITDSETSEPLPKNSAAVHATNLAQTTNHLLELEESLSVQVDDAPFISAQTALQQLPRKLNILVIDDEAIYISAITSLVEKTALNDSLIFHSAASSEEAFALAQKTSMDLVIADIDLGPYTVNGLVICEQLRKNNPNQTQCVHSNRNFPEDYRRAFAIGVDIFFNKPMSRLQLLEVVMHAAKRQVANLKPEKSSAAAGLIAIIDDDAFITEAWQEMLHPETLLTFDSPKAFRLWARTNAEELSYISIFIIDLYFDNDEDNGFALAKALKQLTTAPIIMSTDASVSPNADVDLVIAKEPMNREKLQELVKSKLKEVN